MEVQKFILQLNLFFIVILSILSSVSSEITFSYPTSTYLLNGNLFIIHKYGIDICDNLLTKIIDTPIIFSEEEQISTTYSLSKVLITKFDDGYIICLINDKIYIFDNEGHFLYKSERIDREKNPDYYSLNIKDNYHFYIGFIANNLLNLYYYEYIISENKTELIASKEDSKVIHNINIFNKYNLNNKGISCHVMINENIGETLACFYILNRNENTFAVGFYVIDGTKINEPIRFWPASEDCEDIQFLKVDINKDHSKALVCLILPNKNNNCFVYDINESGFSMNYLNCNNKICRNEYYGLKVNYFPEKDEFISSCLGENGNITYCIFNNNFNYEEINKFENCNNINGYSTVFSNSTNKYYIISDEFCNNENIPFKPLKEEEKVEEEEKEKEEEIEEQKEGKEKEEELEDQEEKGEIEDWKEEEKEQIKEKKEKEEREIEVRKEEEEKKEEIEKQIEIEEEIKEKKEKEEREIEIRKEEEEEKEETEEHKEKEEYKREKEEEEEQIVIGEEIENKDENEGEEEIIEYKCKLKKCKICDKKSEDKNLCKKCNVFDKYYPIKAFSSFDYELDDYIDCFNEKTKPSNFYLNGNYYKPCFESCASCEYGGNEIDNNCTTCEKGFILKPDSDLKNCVIKCQYLYYYTYYNQYKCTLDSYCPDEYNLLINDKGKCINNCSLDNIYQFQYNGECLKGCPTNTSDKEYNYLCQDNSINKCVISERDIIISNENITEKDIAILAKNYAKEFSYTDNHISSFRYNNYEIIFYKNNECISNLSLEAPKVDLGRCYEKIQNNYSIDENLVLALVTEKKGGLSYPKLVSFSIFDPDEGEKLEVDKICQDEPLMVNEDLSIKIDNKEKYLFIKQLSNQNIDIFDEKSDFYTDLCFRFDSPIDKDIALKDRISLFFPNITLCENGCITKGVNPTTMRANCECKLNNLINNNFLSHNAFYQSRIGEIQEIISNTNIEIITCIKEFFKYKYYSSSIGFYIILVLIFIQIMMTYLLYKKCLNPIKKYIIDLVDKYIFYINPKVNDFKRSVSGPVKKKKIRKTHKIKTNSFNNKKNILLKNNDINPKRKHKTNKFNKNIFLINNISHSSETHKLSPELSLKTNIDKRLSSNVHIFDSKYNDKILPTKSDNKNLDMEKYLETEFDDMVYEDVKEKDKRKFCTYFIEKLKADLLIINTIFNNDPLRPKPIKILLFILDIDLYLFVNALFINEEFVSDVFHSTKKEKFFTFVTRSFDRIFYTTLVGVIVNIIIECFFLEENKLKVILKRGKGNVELIKYKIFKELKSLLNRLFYFVVISFIITSFTLYYIACFNNIYPHMNMEWIKSSIFILIIMQILPVLFQLFVSIVRYLSFCINSEKLYKISLILS